MAMNRAFPCAPALPFAFFALLLHFVWEMLQAPLWVGMAAMPHAQGVRVCGIAALGDLVIALLALWAGQLVQRQRFWLLGPRIPALAAYYGVGMLLTIGYEYAATGPLARWTYDVSQPRLPILGTGLAPVLQWIAVPALCLWLTRTHVRGLARSRRAA
jgi:hypothetical protein